MMRVCTVAECFRPYRCSGFCNAHYKRWLRLGGVADLAGNTEHSLNRTSAKKRIAARTVPRGECLIYTAGRESRSGHVSIRVGDGRSVGVHRATWIAAYGEPASGLVVRHSCDTPRCVNLEHLLLGTVADNNADRDTRGRHVALQGEAHGNSKLTDQTVEAIRARLLVPHPDPQWKIGADYGVSQGTVSLIRRGKAWQHIT